MRGFAGKSYLVTGGTQGIGEGIALRIAEEGGSRIMIAGRDPDRGAKVTAELERRGAKAVFVRAELSKAADCVALVRAADEAFGRLDGLVNAAALSTRGTLDESSIELWDHLFAVNVRAPFILCQHAARIMRREGRGGAMVNIVSNSSHAGEPYLTAYCSSKGALATFTKNIAYALAKERIRVNGVNMGWAYTPGEDSVQKKTGAPADWLEQAEAKQPFGRLLRPRDVAGLAAFLLSDEAEMMTGSIVEFDQVVLGAHD
jgi:NAD(P)-dependent dehydrogenase (short-subunit alcohol dehydrogenase family)